MHNFGIISKLHFTMQSQNVGNGILPFGDEQLIWKRKQNKNTPQRSRICLKIVISFIIIIMVIAIIIINIYHHHCFGFFNLKFVVVVVVMMQDTSSRNRPTNKILKIR